MPDGSSTAAPDSPTPEVEGIGDNEIAQRLAMSFATLMVGQLFSGEGDWPYYPFWAEASPQWSLTPEVFRSVMGFDESRDLRMYPVRLPPRRGRATSRSWPSGCTTPC